MNINTNTFCTSNRPLPPRGPQIRSIMASPPLPDLAILPVSASPETTSLFSSPTVCLSNATSPDEFFLSPSSLISQSRSAVRSLVHTPPVSPGRTLFLHDLYDRS
jgi:hypothetical protein